MGTVGVIRDTLDDLRRFLHPLPDSPPGPPLPPPLPDARVVFVPGRGEVFVREAPGPGGGPAVLLLHGWTLSADLNWFSGGYEVASRHGHVVAPDVRGHGRGTRSEQPFTLEGAADDAAGLVRELGVGRVVVAGYSMGGSIAMVMARRHPELVAGLVLASTALQWRNSFYERVLWGGMAGVEYVLRFGAPQGITDRYLRHAMHQSPDLGPYRSWVKGEARRGDAGDIAASGRALAAFDARPLAAAIDIPTAVVVTCQDRLIRPDRQRLLADAIKGSHLVEVDGAHNSWMVKPVDFAEALDKALGMVMADLGHETFDAEGALGQRGVPATVLRPVPPAMEITGL